MLIGAVAVTVYINGPANRLKTSISEARGIIHYFLMLIGITQDFGKNLPKSCVPQIATSLRSSASFITEVSRCMSILSYGPGRRFAVITP